MGVVPASFNLQAWKLPRQRTLRAHRPMVRIRHLHVRAAGLGIHGIGRLKPGVTIQQARADMERVTGHLAEAYPDADKGSAPTIIPLKEQMVGDVRATYCWSCLPPSDSSS